MPVRLAAMLLLLFAGAVYADAPPPSAHHGATSAGGGTDAHLLALAEIDDALARHDFDAAARIAETRLGMSSLEAHGAAHVAQFMPAEMREIGTGMHRAASRFALEAQNASVGNDVRPALAALSTVMRQCVACHAAFRMH
jgi:hypothetical protein